MSGKSDEGGHYAQVVRVPHSFPYFIFHLSSFIIRTAAARPSATDDR